jgi:hydroxymethylpyrimidine pyrophosphatase-like HAD family hydrolase
MTASEIAGWLTDIPGLRMQEAERQQEFKLSYYVEIQRDQDDFTRQIETRLARHDIRAAVIYSTDPAKEVGLLDILPDQAAKDAALRYLQTKAELPEDRVVYAGDSGNDLAAFLSGFKAIVVSNTPEDVKDRVRLRAQRPDRIFVATYPHAKGVIQGCRHFGVFEG